MDWTAATWWWIVTAVLVAAELATGTFYLLMLAVGTAGSALAAHAGAGVSGQLIVASVIAVATVGFWQWRRPRQRGEAASNPDVNIDIGNRVRVDAWTPEGTARVHYRGAGWDARFAGAGVPSPGEHVIRAVRANVLVLDRLPS